MSEKHIGRVCTVCPECGKRQWVEVIFPSLGEIRRYYFSLRKMRHRAGTH